MDDVERERERLVNELLRLAADCERARSDNKRDRKGIRNARKRIAKRTVFLKTCAGRRQALRRELRSLGKD